MDRGRAQVGQTQLNKPSWWEPFYQFSTSRFAWVLGLALIAFPILGAGIVSINTSVHLKDLLPRASNLLESYGWLQNEIGPLVPVEVVVQFPLGPNDERADKQMVARAAVVEQLRKEIERLDSSGGTIAATTFAPDLPLESGARGAMLRRVVGRHLVANQDRLDELGFLRHDESHELWRISTRVSSDQRDYAVFLSELQQTVDRFSARARPATRASRRAHGKSLWGDSLDSNGTAPVAGRHVSEFCLGVRADWRHHDCALTATHRRSIVDDPQRVPHAPCVWIDGIGWASC